MDFKGQIWKRVQKMTSLVWNRIRIWGTGRHIPTKNSQEYIQPPRPLPSYLRSRVVFVSANYKSSLLSAIYAGFPWYSGIKWYAESAGRPGATRTPGKGRCKRRARSGGNQRRARKGESAKAIQASVVPQTNWKQCVWKSDSGTDNGKIKVIRIRIITHPKGK